VLEAGAAHPERVEQFTLDELAERLPGARGDELAEDEVAEIAVGGCQSWAEPQPLVPVQQAGEKRPGVGRRRA
jgi:hypothetical protein